MFCQAHQVTLCAMHRLNWTTLSVKRHGSSQKGAPGKLKRDR